MVEACGIAELPLESLPALANLVLVATPHRGQWLVLPWPSQL